MTPQLDGGLGFPILLAIMVVALLLRSALGARGLLVLLTLLPLL